MDRYIDIIKYCVSYEERFRKMHIEELDSSKIKNFIAFQQKIYEGDENYRDIQSISLKSILKAKAKLNNGSYIKGYILYSKDKTILACFVLAVMDRLNSYLQLAFLDFVDDEQVFAGIYEFAKAEGKRLGLSRLVLGLNLHVNYGLGLLADNFDKAPSFGTAYNKAYYIEHIEKYMKNSELLHSYRIKISDMDMGLSDKIRKSFAENFTIKKADFKNIEATANLYTAINNAAFTEHKYYYESRADEDIELLREFSYIIKEENLLFIYHKGEAVGFMLWYPDFNQLLKKGEGINLFSLIKLRLLSGKIDTAKVVEIGIIPKFKNTGAIIALFDYLYRNYKDKYSYLESGWVMDSNIDSVGMARRFMGEAYKSFKVYEEEL